MAPIKIGETIPTLNETPTQPTKQSNVITYITTDTKINQIVTMLQIVAILLTIVVSIRVLFFKKS